ncbi:MAG TPA: transglycosylase SLT domain-containing protein [Streptosporangiaceae bacterium]|nr:transglycosylase SLT domain-containing protein [Streptosporangiaceae bacterium]
MANYTFSQLMGLWEQAGGSKGFAGLMAGVAEVESGGNPQAYNPSGATGLWQIEWPLYKGIVPGAETQQDLYNPQVNAAAAVKLSGNSMTGIYDNWLRFEPAGAAEAIAKQNGQAAPSAPPAAQSLGTGSSSGPLADLTGAIGQAGTLLGDAAKALDWFFHFFKPGQGWRIAFGGAAVLGAYGGVRSWQSASQSDDPGSALPLAVLLFGLAALAGFMTLRQWPQPGGKPIQPGAYAVDILEGKPPQAGTAPASDAPAIEVGLGAILALWGASKAAQGLSGLGGLLAGLGALLGSGAGEDV